MNNAERKEALDAAVRWKPGLTLTERQQKLIKILIHFDKVVRPTQNQKRQLLRIKQFYNL